MQNAKFFLKYNLHHLIFWMLVFGTWYLLRYEGYATEKLAFQVTFIKVADLAMLVYITNYVLIPFLLYKKRYLLFVIIFIVMIAGSSIYKMNLIGHLTKNFLLLDLQGNLKQRIYDNVIPHFFLVIAGAAFKLMLDQIRLQKTMTDLAKEKAESELSFLKSQINPHFLFNSLNSVYFLIDKNNQEARQTLHKFSEMLRYQLYEANDDKIPIEKEISYLRDYVDLQKLRKDENYTVAFDCSPDVKGFRIEPLLLIPFVENAFKHISHKSNKTNFVNVEMIKNNGHFQFTVENSKDSNSHTTEKHGGIGLQNVKRRLELIYPGKHELEIKDEPDTYKIQFKLKI